MKFSLALLGSVFAQEDPACAKCDDIINDFNDWHGNSNIVCSRYTDPRELFSVRGACKECKIQCVPAEDKCAGISDIEAGFWNRTGRKVKEQYINRASKMAAERALERANNQFEKEQEKYNNYKKKMEEKAAKIANKNAKKENWQKWRDDKRAKAEADRAQRKQEKKERKAAAKAAKELRKQQREQKKQLRDNNKVKFAFYADMEEHYAPLCPDMFLIQN